MNKAFVREPDADGKAFCPRCGALGIAVGSGPLETHILPEFRDRLHGTAWYCSYARCSVAYFDQFDSTVMHNELKAPVYPQDPAAPMCACFGFRYEDIEADVNDGTPTRIRALLAKSKSPEAHCQTLAADGQCCMREVQKTYMTLRGQ